ncbi:DUF4352 domain-containing protein [Actinotalea sp.]|uniref:DUF4352 domain-containing protein n=1 Tax=Actinotalea sp. TaxID=1872145 RepID=UPI003561A6CD
MTQPPAPAPQPYPAQPYPGQPQPGHPYPAGPVPPGASGPQPPAPRRGFFARHKVLTGIGIAVVLLIAFASAGGSTEPDEQGTAGSASSAVPDAVAGGTTSETDQEQAAAEPAEEPAEEPEPEPEPAAPGIGAVVADGKFEFTVTSVETGVARVGDDYLHQDAQGQFVLVRMTVKNVGDEAQYFDGSSQELVDTEGRRHSADSGAAIYLGDANSFLNQINPGNQVDGVVVFDIPVDAQLASITLHDSMFSGGVSVDLG